jgi:hypothetical protein
MQKIIITLFLIGQFSMTPERQDAMDKAAVAIRSKQGQIVATQSQITSTQKELAIMQNQITKLQNAVIQTQAAKQKMITDSKAKLGLDATWSWSDTANSFVQAK